MNIYTCLCMFIHIYTYSVCMNNFLPGDKELSNRLEKLTS